MCHPHLVSVLNGCVPPVLIDGLCVIFEQLVGQLCFDAFQVFCLVESGGCPQSDLRELLDAGHMLWQSGSCWHAWWSCWLFFREHSEEDHSFCESNQVGKCYPPMNHFFNNSFWMPAFDVGQIIWSSFQLQFVKCMTQLLHSGHGVFPDHLLLMIRCSLPRLVDGFGVRIKQ